jgi:uncharacterized protein
MDSASRLSPTVIVARKVQPGCEAAFEAWMTRLLSAAHASPGHIGADLQRPDAIHPDEWVVVYRFVDAVSRQAWLDSPQRHDLMDEAKHLVRGEPRQQVLATAGPGQEVRALSSARVSPGRETEYFALHHEIEHAMRSFEGFINVEIFAAVPGVQDEVVTVLTFTDQASLEGWLESPVRRRQIERLDALTETGRTLSVVGGFGGWFEHVDGAEPKRWKQAVVVLIALFPTVVLLNYLSAWALPDLAMIPATFVGNVVGISLLTWVLMPPLTRRLSGWLSR